MGQAIGHHPAMQPADPGIEQDEVLKVNGSFGKDIADLSFDVVGVSHRGKLLKHNTGGGSAACNPAQGHVQAVERRTRH